MRVVFLASTRQDLVWFKRYYIQVFSEGRSKADAQFPSCQSLLSANPDIGRPSARLAAAREFHIQRTPFTFIYRPFADRIEILRVIDERGPEFPGSANY